MITKPFRVAMIVGVIIIVPLMMWLLLLIGVSSETELEWVYVAYELDNPADPTAYVQYASSEPVVLPDLSYPNMRVRVSTNTRVSRMPSRYSSKPGEKIGDLSKTEHFSLILSDGLGPKRGGAYFHYPMKAHAPEPSGEIKRMMDGDGEVAAIMRESWNEKHGIGDSIEEGRRMMLVDLAQDALRRSGREWIAHALDHGSSKRKVNGDGRLNVFLVVLGMSVFIWLVLLGEYWWKKRRMNGATREG